MCASGLYPAYSISKNTDNHARTAGAIILRVSYGYEVKDVNDPFVELADRATEQFSLATSPGSFLVDIIPTCIYVQSCVRISLTGFLSSALHS